MSKQRLLIFIVAFNAEKHIEKVLGRIPAIIYTKYDYEILIIDDSSADDTFEIARRFGLLHRELNLKVLFNPDNLGYGGNQKLGYHYAIENGFDAVVLLHGDGQYAPELIEDMVTPIVEGKADIVLGSRMIEAGKALRGGMPLYKYIGNKILTSIQNALLKSKLSEFHSGYRAFSVSALREMPFERNSPDFHFDTQILIQAIFRKLRILEIAIPTYYGDEICHVNGMKYAWNVIKCTLISKAHTFSIIYQREYDVDDEYTVRYTPKLGYPSSHTFAINSVREKSTVLDIGCDQGYVSQELKSKGCYMVGVDVTPLLNAGRVDEFYLMDMNKADNLPALDRFDSILLLDIIEHLDMPELFLDTLRKKAKRKEPTVIITAPNIAFFAVRCQLLVSHFNYGKQGILDMTHKRLFTFKSLTKLCVGSGYQILKVKGIPAPFPKALGKNRLSMFLLKINVWLIKFSKSMFSYQIYMEVRPTPVISELLGYAIRESAAKDEGQSNKRTGKVLARLNAKVERGSDL